MKGVCFLAGQTLRSLLPWRPGTHMWSAFLTIWFPARLQFWRAYWTSGISRKSLSPRSPVLTARPSCSAWRSTLRAAEHWEINLHQPLPLLAAKVPLLVPSGFQQPSSTGRSLHVMQWIVYLSINLFTYLSIYLSIYLSVYLSTYLSIYLSI